MALLAERFASSRIADRSTGFSRGRDRRSRSSGGFGVGVGLVFTWPSVSAAKLPDLVCGSGGADWIDDSSKGAGSRYTSCGIGSAGGSVFASSDESVASGFDF